MSALVKSIRLRRTHEALKWFVALWSFPSLRERVARRILISSAEDGFSHKLIAKVATWYRGPHRLIECQAAAQIALICASPSWWHCREGHDYIFAWLSAERLAAKAGAASFSGCELELDSLIHAKELVRGIAAFVRMSIAEEFSNIALIDLIGRWAERSGSERTVMLYDAWRAVAPALGRDGNIAGFLLYDLLGGAIPDTPLVGASPPTVQLTALRDTWDGRELSVPAWANDGIHARASGTIDERFAGLVPNFARMCMAHDRFGRLDPADSWDDLPPV